MSEIYEALLWDATQDESTMAMTYRDRFDRRCTRVITDEDTRYLVVAQRQGGFRWAFKCPACWARSGWYDDALIALELRKGHRC